MENKLVLTAKESDSGKRCDVFLAESLPKYSRAFFQSVMAKDMVQKDGKALRKKDLVSCGDVITVFLPDEEPACLEPEGIPLDIVFEDDDLLIVNKPKGMVVHPAPGNEKHTLVNALLSHCGDNLSKKNGDFRPGIIHRIDKDTSGLLIVAKSDRAFDGLSSQIRDHTFTRIYEAVVYGGIKDDSGRIDLPIGRSEKDRKKMCVTDKNAKEAVTRFEVIDRFDGFTHLRLILETGRTHQIRVHMAHLGHPVAGDPVYGPKKRITSLNGQCLHARVIGFVHPVSGEHMLFDSALPAWFLSFLEKLRRKQQG